MNPVLFAIDRTLSAIGAGLDKIASGIVSLWENEPVAVTGLVTAILDAAIAFNAPIDEGQKTAIIAVVSGIGILIARKQVTPVAS